MYKSSFSGFYVGQMLSMLSNGVELPCIVVAIYKNCYEADVDLSKIPQEALHKPCLLVQSVLTGVEYCAPEHFLVPSKIQDFL